MTDVSRETFRLKGPDRPLRWLVQRELDWAMVRCFRCAVVALDRLSSAMAVTSIQMELERPRRVRKFDSGKSTIVPVMYPYRMLEPGEPIENVYGPTRVVFTGSVVRPGIWYPRERPK